MARSPVKRFFGTLFFLIAVLVVLAVVVLLYAASVNDRDFPLVDRLDQVYVVGIIVLSLIAVLLLLLILVRRADRRSALSDDAEAFFIPETDRDALARARAADFEREFQESTTYATGPEIVVYNLPVVPLMGRAWDDPPKRSKRNPQPVTYTYYYPRSVERAVYVNDYIDIGKGDKVKLRTLLAGPKDADKKEFDARHTIKKAPKKKADAKSPAPAAPGAESPAPPASDPFSEGPAAATPPGPSAQVASGAAVAGMSSQQQTEILMSPGRRKP
ncbi:MAG TPA: hypothetical protein VFH47_08415 [Candidatus Thermoplasmatota archaeon]|nr:hypothetical protein [Candidatus Thermoplasmatota archaeon]